MNPQSIYLDCLGRQLHVNVWGAQQRETVIAWHGLARTGRDFDALAQHLSDRYRVVCPDTLGRGLSEWSPQPQAEYQLAFYARQAAALMDALDLAQAHWVGTSMGGAIAIHGLGSAQAPLRGRLQSLVLNDIAPQLAASAIERIKTYAAQPPRFARLTEFEAFLRQVYAPFGWLSDAQWRQMAETSYRRLPDGTVTPHYDPAAIAQLSHHPDDYHQWQHWDRIDLPVLCLHGRLSDLIVDETIAAMHQRGPGAAGLLQVIEVDGVGHAPALNTAQQWAWVRDFIDAHATAATAISRR